MIAFHRIPQDPHTAGSSLIFAGKEISGMVLKDIPGKGAGLPTAKSRHDGAHGTFRIVKTAVIRFRSPIKAVGAFRLHNDDLRRLTGVLLAEKGGYGSSHGTHARLQEDMSRDRALQLMNSLHAHGQITLHDEKRYLLVSRPCSVLHQDPAVFLSLTFSEADRIIIAELCNLSMCPLGTDIFQPFLCGACRHVDHSFLGQLPGSPCNAPSVIAVCGSHEGIGAGWDRVKFGNRRSGFPGQDLGQSVAAPKALEGVEAETEALILDIQPSKAQTGSQSFQT